MIYKIDGKYYVRVQGYYKEVQVTKKVNGLEFKPIADSKIEVGKAKKVEVVDVEKLEKSESKPDYSNR